MKEYPGSPSFSQIVADLGINVPYTKGQSVAVRNCWHFSTDGNAVDYLFADTEDFIDGMNRIYLVAQIYHVTILAFCLMDNHIHFILYGLFDECNRFVHEYIRRTSMHITHKYGNSHKLRNVPVDFQIVDNDIYLKTAICYVIKNPPQAGLPFNSWDYPWSSGSLYMRKNHSDEMNWTEPVWMNSDSSFQDSLVLPDCRLKNIFKTNGTIKENLRMKGRLIFPGEYVATEIVDRIFKSHKGFNYFMCVSKDSDIESRGGTISRLSIPDQEMRQNKIAVCKEMFGVTTTNTLSTEQRIKLARTLKNRYNSSPKQIARMCGLVYDEIKSLLN